jgi:hypothetical protein
LLGDTHERSNPAEELEPKSRFKEPVEFCLAAADSNSRLKEDL